MVRLDRYLSRHNQQVCERIAVDYFLSFTRQATLIGDKAGDDGEWFRYTER